MSTKEGAAIENMLNAMRARAERDPTGAILDALERSYQNAGRLREEVRALTEERDKMREALVAAVPHLNGLHKDRDLQYAGCSATLRAAMVDPIGDCLVKARSALGDER